MLVSISPKSFATKALRVELVWHRCWCGCGVVCEVVWVVGMCSVTHLLDQLNLNSSPPPPYTHHIPPASHTQCRHQRMLHALSLWPEPIQLMCSNMRCSAQRGAAVQCTHVQGSLQAACTPVVIICLAGHNLVTRLKAWKIIMLQHLTSCGLTAGSRACPARCLCPPALCVQRCREAPAPWGPAGMAGATQPEP